MGLADLIIRDTERRSRVKGHADGFANGQFQGHVEAFEQEIKKRPELADMINLKLKRIRVILSVVQTYPDGVPESIVLPIIEKILNSDTTDTETTTATHLSKIIEGLKNTGYLSDARSIAADQDKSWLKITPLGKRYLYRESSTEKPFMSAIKDIQELMSMDFEEMYYSEKRRLAEYLDSFDPEYRPNSIQKFINSENGKKLEKWFATNRDIKISDRFFGDDPIIF